MFYRLLAATALAACSAAASADALTGNPNADGWTKGGNSHQTGVYVRDNNEPGALNYDFDVYRREGTLATANGALLAGDHVLGVGGVCNGAITGTTVDNCAINALAKFGSPTASFAAASAYDAEDGHGGDIYGGPGYILARIQLGGLTAAVNRWDGASFTAQPGFANFLAFAAVTEAGQYIRYDSTVQPTTRIRSWEVLLDLDAMARLGYTDIPVTTVNSEAVMQGQHPGGFHFVKALAPPLPVTGVPEPESWALLIAGFGLTGAMARRRRLAL